jgi:hypothetical protein
LPHIVNIGAQRSGTTSLFQYLGAHPSVVRPVVKEIHYLTDRFHRGERWYRAHFPRAGRSVLTYEATPYYLFHPLAPARARQTMPAVRVVVLFRNPVDRAYSHYVHSVQRGFETLSFEDALAAEPVRLEGEAERLAADPDYRSVEHRVFSYAARGQYASQLQRWFDHFPPEQVLPIRSEDLYADPAREVRRVLEFVGLPDGPPPRFVVHAKGPSGGAPPPPADIRRQLEREFAPHNRRLEEMLGRSMDWAG